MYQRSDAEKAIVGAFLSRWFDAPAGPTSADGPLVKQILSYVDQRFGRMKYILGLAIDFTVLAQQVAGADRRFRPLAASEDHNAIFSRYPLVEKRGSTTANTLTLTVGASQFGIRKIEELVVDAFHKMERSDFPSAYVYNTGQWTKYQDLLGFCFRLSEGGRVAAVNALFDYGLSKLDKNTFYFQPVERVRVFDAVLAHYPRSADGENGGLTLQAIAYAWCTSMFSHLQVDADKVRTGSKRQRRFGDIDGYSGLVLELSVEVKDLVIEPDNYERQVRQFAELARSHGIHALVVADGFTKKGAELVIADELIPVSINDMQRVCAIWDWWKQEHALQAMLHYLAHVEQNPGAVRRLLAFIASVDPDHTSLAHVD